MRCSAPIRRKRRTTGAPTDVPGAGEVLCKQPIMTRFLILLLFPVLCPVPAVAATNMIPGNVEIKSTWHSIGVRWDIQGDDNHDATGQLMYAAPGESLRPAFPLLRVDGNGGNYLAGSILFLKPGTRYTVQISIDDPDGGSDRTTLAIDTRNLPYPATGGRELHVTPGNGGGSGTRSDPYLGLETAWAAAQPGDTLLLHSGRYGAVRDNNGASGQPGNRITIKSAGDGKVTLDYLELANQSHIWIEGLEFRYNPAAGSDTALYSSLLNPGYDNGFQSMHTDINDIVISRNSFIGYKHSIRAGPRTDGWVIIDNTIVGDKELGASGTASFDGEGVELGHGNNHIVAYNSITRVADGISFPGDNCDLFSNDIFDLTDDGIELDGGEANTRAWHNRIHNVGHNGFSFQPQYSGPWYLVRNQVINYQESGIKFRDTDRFVAIHNTFITWNEVLDHWSGHLLRGFLRNNLWISVNNAAIWKRSDYLPDWRTDMDYEGFDWGNNRQPFDVGGTKYSNLADLAAGTGLETHGVRIDHTTCFDVLDVPGPPPLTTIPPQWVTPAFDCAAVDAGQTLIGLNDGFTGQAPDLGVIERGLPPPQVGPRNDPLPPVITTGVRLDVLDASVPYEGSTVLTWTSRNADSCTASGAWTGSRATAGTETVGPLTANSTYLLTCAGSGGTASAGVTVSVTGNTGNAVQESSPGGAGSLGVFGLLWLLAGMLHKRRVKGISTPAPRNV